MQYRLFGKTELKLSEIGFGSWAIGGKSFGQVAKQDAIDALSKAEELGCNFVDTAIVYGESESILGEFLKGRRDRWVVASKYSDGSQSISKTIDEQLKRLNVDYIDFYQIHWTPKDQSLYEKLYDLKRSGKVRYVGVSLYNITDIDYVIDKTRIDGFQIAFSLLDPYPLLQKLGKIKKANIGVIARSCLHYGFLSGKYNYSTIFNDPNDQRSNWSRERITKTVNNVNIFRFLDNENHSLAQAAIAYPLAYNEVSSVIVSCKSVAQAEKNFQVPVELTQSELIEINSAQKDLGLHDISIKQRLKYGLSRIKMAVK